MRAASGASAVSFTPGSCLAPVLSLQEFSGANFTLSKHSIPENAVAILDMPGDTPDVKAWCVRVQLHQADFAEAWLSFPTGQ